MSFMSTAGKLAVVRFRGIRRREIRLPWNTTDVGPMP
ncbi:hypothetical protein T01_12275 [Trichinella spiralis]|uniref:Uncharacterized protein n=1 Tax=Trichinella spiralis TaxID=6334 RepID=A0A0V0Z261_TRISP|nr:hypothetical protein T01_12275 [Trichinella spiralis]